MTRVAAFAVLLLASTHAGNAVKRGSSRLRQRSLQANSASNAAAMAAMEADLSARVKAILGCDGEQCDDQRTIDAIYDVCVTSGIMSEVDCRWGRVRALHEIIVPSEAAVEDPERRRRRLATSTPTECTDCPIGRAVSVNDDGLVDAYGLTDKRYNFLATDWETTGNCTSGSKVPVPLYCGCNGKWGTDTDWCGRPQNCNAGENCPGTKVDSKSGGGSSPFLDNNTWDFGGSCPQAEFAATGASCDVTCHVTMESSLVFCDCKKGWMMYSTDASTEKDVLYDFDNVYCADPDYTPVTAGAQGAVSSPAGAAAIFATLAAIAVAATATF